MVCIFKIKFKFFKRNLMGYMYFGVDQWEVQ